MSLPHTASDGVFDCTRPLLVPRYTAPWAIMASATLRKPAMFAPAT